MATASANPITHAALLESFRHGAEAAELVLQEALRIARLPAKARMPNSGDNQRALHGFAGWPRTWKRSGKWQHTRSKCLGLSTDLGKSSN